MMVSEMDEELKKRVVVLLFAEASIIPDDYVDEILNQSIRALKKIKDCVFYIYTAYVNFMRAVLMMMHLTKISVDDMISALEVVKRLYQGE